MATKAFRFALGSPSATLSGIWRVWTHEDDVHLAVHSGHEEVMLTAHPTGRWRIAVGSNVSRWTRPKEFRPGWTRGPDLVIPYSATPVRSPANDPYASETVTWLPPPPPGYRARFTLLFATPRAEETRWRPPDTAGTQGVTVLPLRTAGALHLCRIDEPIAPEDATPARAEHQLDSVPHSVSYGFRVIVEADQAGLPSLRESHGE